MSFGQRPLPPEAPAGDATSSATPYGFEPEDKPELTPAEVSLLAQEQAIHDAKRALRRARQLPTRFREQARALERQAQDLWCAILEEVRR